MSHYDAERFDNLYNSSAYASNTNNWEDSVSRYRAEAFYAALTKANIVSAIQTVIDVGCGSGGVLHQLHVNYGAKIGSGNVIYSGIDPSSEAIETAKRLYPNSHHNNITYDCRHLMDNAGGEKYSVLSLIHVLEHCPDMLEMLRLCESQADYIYLNIPIEVNVYYTLRPNVLAMQYQKYGHVHFFSESFIKAWIANNGYEIIARVYSADFEVNKSGFLYNVLKIVRRTLGFVIGEKLTAWLVGGYSLGLLIRPGR